MHFHQTPAEKLDKLLKTFPKEKGTVNRKLMHGGDFRVCDSVLKDECSSQKRNCICINGFAGNSKAPQKVGEIRSIGIPREPEDFVARAAATGHQRNLFAEDWSARDSFVLEYASIRKWLKRASELASKEKDLHDSLDPLDPEVARVLKGKKLLALEEILNDIGFPDRHLVEKGWLVEDENPDLDMPVVVRRFGLMQKSKVRVIDDFKQCGVNGSTGLHEKYVLYSMDAIAATLV